MQITDRWHAQIIVDAFKSHDLQHDYFGMGRDDTAALRSVLTLIVQEWPEFRQDEWVFGQVGFVAGLAEKGSST